MAAPRLLRESVPCSSPAIKRPAEESNEERIRVYGAEKSCGFYQRKRKVKRPGCKGSPRLNFSSKRRCAECPANPRIYPGAARRARLSTLSRRCADQTLSPTEDDRPEKETTAHP